MLKTCPGAVPWPQKLTMPLLSMPSPFSGESMQEVSKSPMTSAARDEDTAATLRHVVALETGPPDGRKRADEPVR